MLRLKTMVSILGLLVIMGCSKDEPGDNLLKDNQVKTGVFLDSAVEGLYYETSTRNGLTNAKGEFKYLEGERITFFLGDLELGSNLAEAIMTPISIARTPKADLYTPEVQYMAALLQTLDIDGDPGNGIKLVPEVLNAIEFNNMNLKQPERNMFLGIVKNVKEKTGIELNEVYPEEAAAHLAETLGENFEIYTSLLPFIESWVNHTRPKTSTEWNHEFDESGKLLRSVQYEKYPRRIVAEYRYEAYDEYGYPNEAIRTAYWLGSPTQAVVKRVLEYDENHNVIAFGNYSMEGEFYSRFVITKKDSDGFITEVKSFTNAGEFVFREVYLMDENKNNIEKIKYSSETSSESSDILLHLGMTYTSFGDLKTIIEYRQQGSDRITTYFYRDDNTLERTRRTFSNNNTIYDYFYDEQEVKLREFHITQGDWRSEYVEFYPDGNYKLVNTYYQEWLQEVATFDEDGYAELKILDLDRSGSFQIDFRDPDWILLKIEYYDDEGTYLRTEYYENNTLVTTEYA